MTRASRKRPHPMGALSSKVSSKRPPATAASHGWGWSGPPGEHSPYPTDPAPYPGHQYSYCFLDVMAGYKSMENRLNLGPRAVSTDIEDYRHDLEACYSEGYQLNAYVRVPGMRNTVEVEDWGLKTPYQAILSKPLKTDSKQTDVKLCIEKCILSTKTSAFDCLENENDLLSTIKKNAEQGGRLLCAVPVGYVRSDTTNNQYGVLGMELFFNIPTEKTSTRYTYHTIKVPAKYYTTLDATQTTHQVMCDSDFQGQMELFMNQGWKLIDICIDTMALAEAFRMTCAVRYVDTVWVFEKDQDKLDDTTPRYEGVIIEYLHKIKKSRSGDLPVKDWRPVIAGMGVLGWELAAMVQSPVIIQSGFITFNIKMMMIFQRKLIPSFQCIRTMKALEVADGYPESSYNASGSSSSNPSSTGGVCKAKAASEESTGYYNQILKKYIYSTDGSVSDTRPMLLRTQSIGGNNRCRNNGASRSESHAHLNGVLPQGSGFNNQSNRQRRHSVDSDAMLPSYTEAMHLSSIPVT